MPDKTFLDIDQLALTDRDYNAFGLDDDSKVARRIIGKGDFTPSGLKTNFRITTMNVTSTATALPVTALANRNSMSIHNLSTTDILYIGNSGVTADRNNGTTSGWEIETQEVFNTDVTDSIVIYGRTSGATIQIKIIELA